MKCMQATKVYAVLEVENLKPLVSAECCSLFKQRCKCLDCMNMLGAVANKKIIDVQRAFDTSTKCFYYLYYKDHTV